MRSKKTLCFVQRTLEGNLDLIFQEEAILEGKKLPNNGNQSIFVDYRYS
jgi:hypothetical protein